MVGSVVKPGSVGFLAPNSVAPEHTGEGGASSNMLKSSTAGLNIAMGMFCAYFGADYLGSQWGLERTRRMGLALGAMVVLLVVEMLLFIIRATKFDEIDRKRRRRAELSFNGLAGAGINYGAKVKDS